MDAAGTDTRQFEIFGTTAPVGIVSGLLLPKALYVIKRLLCGS
jgi:hypothetical protein